MIIVYVGVNRRKGVSNKGQGTPYDMCKLLCAVPLEHVKTEHMELTGYGFKVEELDVNPEIMEQFNDIPVFSQVDVNIQPKPTNFKHTWVESILPPKTTKRA